jgi:hypothetical protein
MIPEEYVMDILITVDDEKLAATLDEELAPKTVQAIVEALPLEETASMWGDEIYFSIPVTVEPENAVETVNVGDLGYWPQGNAFCIFYGKTPMSRSEDEIVPASAVNPIGRIEGAERLKQHEEGETVRIERRLE